MDTHQPVRPDLPIVRRRSRGSNQGFPAIRVTIREYAANSRMIRRCKPSDGKPFAGIAISFLFLKKRIYGAVKTKKPTPLSGSGQERNAGQSGFQGRIIVQCTERSSGKAGKG